MVFTRLAAVKKKKYSLPTINNFNTSKMNDNADVSNSVNSTDEITVIAETQTQIVEATQNTDVFYGYPEAPTEDVADLVQTHATELEKTPVTDVTHGEKSSNETPSNITTPPSLKTTGLVDSSGNQVLPQIEILKVGYSTPKKHPFKLDDRIAVSPTHLTPTPKVSPWFKHDSDQTHCLNLINNLNKFPIKGSEEWLNRNFRQFKKFVEDNELTRVKVLTNMWLADGEQHSFPVKTPEDNFLPSAKARLEKEFEYETLNKKNKELQKNIFSNLTFYRTGSEICSFCIF